MTVTEVWVTTEAMEDMIETMIETAVELEKMSDELLGMITLSYISWPKRVREFSSSLVIETSCKGVSLFSLNMDDLRQKLNGPYVSPRTTVWPPGARLPPHA
jgi:hypothetical protein